MNFGSLGLFGLIGHSYQSKPIRNLLLRLHHVKTDVRARDEIMKELTPLLMAAGRQMMQEEADPQDMVLASTEFISGYTDAEGNPVYDRLNPIVDARTGDEVEPGMIDQLREAVGYVPGGGIQQLWGGEPELPPEE